MVTPNVSFEFFPPRTIDAAFQLHDTVQKLIPFDPSFISVTYGAGGSSRAITREAIDALSKDCTVPVAAHVTAIDATRAELRDLLHSYAKKGIKELVILRGDRPQDDTVAPEHAFGSVQELIAAAQDINDFTIRVAAYPTPHPESRGTEADIEWLKQKFDAGADEAITQFFFEPEDYLRFRDRCQKAGITKPIIPGILPIENWAGARRFAKRCGIAVPQWLEVAFEKAIRDDRAPLLATAIATELCDKLMTEGVDHLHFYTLNRAELSQKVCSALGLTQRLQPRKVA